MTSAREPRRVVVTGLGAISPVGHSAGEAWKNVIAGVSGIAPIASFDTADFPVKIAAEGRGVDPARYFDEKLRGEVERAVRYKRSMALIMVDLDDFKSINEAAGHPQGDAVLAELGSILRKQSRQIDIVSRYGGDEFALILPETGLENAVLHADRIRDLVAAKPFPNRQDPAKPFRVTLSMGVADVDGDRRTAEATLDAADRACFLAKRGGKNRVKSVRDLGEGGAA